ncbi:MAG: DUF2066 domain-containing protein [Nitrococcus sp.]|nr:DUF2066 domain-containing protein [Nitrococcus sp.]
MDTGLAVRVIALSVGLAVLYAGPIAAASPQDLHAAGVPVADQSAQARAQALESAITQVLVAMTGRADLAHSTRVADLVKSPQPYLQQYHYERGADGQLELIARFDGQSLRRALAKRGIPSWQAKRPPVLVWFALDSGDEHGLVNEDTGEQPGEALRTAFADLGIPLILPLLDLEDRQQVRYSDVYGGFSEPVLAASRRYSAELVLMLRVSATATGWNGRWALYRDGTDVSWESRGASIEQMLSDGVQALAASLRPDYTLLPDLTASTLMRIKVNGVGSLERFATVESLLAQLPGVIGVRLSGAGPDWVRMKLTLNVAPPLVQRELSRSQNLEPAAAGTLAERSGDGAGNRSRIEGERVYRLLQ